MTEEFKEFWLHDLEQTRTLLAFWKALNAGLAKENLPEVGMGWATAAHCTFGNDVARAIQILGDEFRENGMTAKPH